MQINIHHAVICRSRPALLATALLSGILLTGLSACSDETSRSHDGTRTEASSDAAHKTKWLEVAAPISPAQWLVSRKEDRPRLASDPDVQRVAQLLSTAHKRYRESERMIANRSAQVEAMLQQIGLSEDATVVLDGLTGIGGEVGQAEGFGAISQYYFNLRAANSSRADALATLKARYGSKS